MQVSDVQLMARLSITRGRGRLGTSAWMVGVAVGVVVAFLLGAPTVGTADGGDDDSRCEGLHGVCFNLCTTADTLGCLDDEPDQPLIKLVCRKIDKQLKKFDCEIPPPVTCPCGDAQTLNDQFEASTFEGAIGCVLNQAEGSVFFRRFDTADNAAPNLALSARLFGPPLDEPTCSYSLTDETGTVLHDVRVPSAQIEEINACIADIRALINQVGCAP